MQSKTQVASDHVRGWILDAYPSGPGKIAVWIITENGERIKLADNFQPKIYVSAKQDEIERLVSRLCTAAYCPHGISRTSTRTPQMP